MLLSLISTLLLLQVEALPNVFQYEIAKAKSFVHTFELPKEKLPTQGPKKLKTFRWEDCSSSVPLVNIKSLFVTPDPLTFPGQLNVEAEFIVKKSLTDPIKVDLKMSKKLLGEYVQIPCIDGFGSCTYDDICQVLSPIGDQCPAPLKDIGISCSCPFNKKDYKLPKTGFAITADVIPSGDYKIQANVTKDGAEAVCVTVYLELE